MDAIAPPCLTASVMQRRSVIVGVVVGIGVIGVGIRLLVLTEPAPPSATPAVGLSVLGYTNSARWVYAQVRLTNKGDRSIGYGEWGSLPHHWIKAETISRPIKYSMLPFVRAGTGTLGPTSNAVFAFQLPRDTVRWKFAVSVRTATARERTAATMIKVATRIGLSSWCRWALERLPYRPRPEHEFESEWLDVPVSPHNNTPAVDGGITSLFNAGHGWPATTEAGG